MKLFTVPVLKLDYQTIFINRNHIITLSFTKSKRDSNERTCKFIWFCSCNCSILELFLLTNQPNLLNTFSNLQDSLSLLIE